MQTLQNGLLNVQISEEGAEMHSIRYGEREYLWNGEPTFWARHSPILFPIVGRVWDGHYISKGKDYQLGQHGFARDMKFELVSASDTECWYALDSNEDTLKKYPYPFHLEIGYRIQDKSVTVLWRVCNPANETMYFQIGAHPAFYWPGVTGDLENVSKQPFIDDCLGWFRFEKKDSILPEPLIKSVLTEKGCIDPNLKLEVSTENGMLRLDAQLFNKDALVFEHNQMHSVELLTADKTPYLRVDFADMPLVGLWSSPGKNAPFVCIEPWLGRCDDVHYNGDYEHKPWINRLEGHQTFSAEYTISILQ